MKLAAVLLLTMMACACGGDKGSKPTPTTPTVTSICTSSVTSPSNVTISATGGTISVALSATGCPWTAQSNASFITVSPASGTGDAIVTLTVALNTGDARTGMVTIAGIKINVTQNKAVNADTVFAYLSAPGDFVGGGQSGELTTATYIVTPTASSNLQQAHVNLHTVNFSSFWNLDFAAPAGQQLTAGTYENALRFPFQPAISPGLSVSSSNGCNQLSGRFQVLEVAFGPGPTLNRLHVLFEQHCEFSSAALTGEVWIPSRGAYPSALAIRH